MKTLHIVTLKKFYLLGETIYTYGGFPAYLDMLSGYFDEIYIIAPITRRQFDNPKRIDNVKFKILPLPCYWNELQLLLLTPFIFLIVSLGISIFSIIGSGVSILEEPDIKLLFIIIRVYIAS